MYFCVKLRLIRKLVIFKKNINDEVFDLSSDMKLLLWGRIKKKVPLKNISRRKTTLKIRNRRTPGDVRTLTHLTPINHA